MLRINTYLDKSGVHGIGLFAGQDIRKGHVVWEFSPHVDLVFDEEQWARLAGLCAEESMQQIRKYSYKEGRKYYVCFDNAQFMNHSRENPNVRSGVTSDINVAARDIKKGEELLCDYFEYSDPDDFNLVMIMKHT